MGIVEADPRLESSPGRVPNAVTWRPMPIPKTNQRPHEEPKPAEHGGAKDDVQDGQRPGVVMPKFEGDDGWQKVRRGQRDHSDKSGGHAHQSGKRDHGSDDPIPKCRCSVMSKVSDVSAISFFVPDSTFNAANNLSLAASISRRAQLIVLFQTGR
ncbi:hypothetical protein [Bradyrhizobium sp. SSUT77]|uniref:hypothetical protein n=1 Tax=Bradyrhizobium sp. SSUT77 TaxID=3040603 RepID=UPI00244BA8CA|nr:hypothetical protein [Bradyrhizobium sp. SSUT77]MDH2347151.1 hypothetical protein [Bradyrhizobium sp. SSUT77]